MLVAEDNIECCGNAYQQPVFKMEIVVVEQSSTCLNRRKMERRAANLDDTTFGVNQI